MATKAKSRAGTKDGTRSAGVIGAALLALLMFSGQIKENPVLAWLPIDLTLLSFALVVIAVAISMVKQGAPGKGVVLFLGLWVVFMFAVFTAPLDDYSTNKTVLLFTVTLLLAVSPFFVLRDRGQRVAFLGAVVAIAAVVGLLTLFLDPTAANDYSNRIILEGSDTIGTARIAGAGALICFIFAITNGATTGKRVVAALVAGVLAYVALQSGSRGPVVAVALSLFAILILSPIFAKYRGRAVAAVLMVGGIIFWWAANSGSDGFTRVLSFLNGEQDASTMARTYIWSSAWEAIQWNPWGFGWGSYSEVNGIYRYPHNVFVEVFYEAGWFTGLLFVGIVIATAIYAARRATTRTETIFFGLLVFAVANAAVSSDINGNRILWVALAAVWAVSARDKASSAHPNELVTKTQVRV